MGNICLYLRRRDWWGLNSLSSHAHTTMPTTYYLVLARTPLIHMCLCTSYLYIMNFVVHFSTLPFPSYYYLQIYHVHVQCCTFRFRSLRSVSPLWTKSFTTTSVRVPNEDCTWRSCPLMFWSLVTTSHGRSHSFMFLFFVRTHSVINSLWFCTLAHPCTMTLSKRN